ncbi:MAG: PAS domain-containing sensor histidine kinase [Gammaproteobacteria bacterium]|nr:PAS domain-containing sensor histidine kinase [Gammaproteobacteria bacterium]
MSNPAIIKNRPLDDFIHANSWLLDVLSSSVVIIDDEANVKYTNTAFTKIINIDNVVAGEHTLSELLPGIRGLEKIIAECLHGGVSKKLNKTIKSNSHEPKLLPICINISPVQSCPGLILTIDVDTGYLRDHFDNEKKLLADRVKKLSSSVVEKTNIVHSLFDKSPVGMMVYNSDGVIIKINSAGRSILEAGKDSLVGRSIYEFYNRDDFIENLSYHVPSNLSVISCSGTTKKLLRCSVNSELDESYRIETFVDVTDMEQARLEIEKAKIAAEQSNTAKTEFLANMSHELRTPMHGILGFSQLGVIEGMSLSSGTVTEYFEKINDVANHLLVMLNDLIDMAKMESDQVNPRRESIDINRLVDIVVSENQALLNIKSMYLVIENNLTDQEISVDNGLVKQVLRNLVVNAINYSPENSHINIFLSNDDGKVKIEVADEGPGVPELEKEAIFEKFVQSSITKDGSGGSGLGLAICKRIVKAHNGDVWVENNKTKGCTFFVTLPQST